MADDRNPLLDEIFSGLYPKKPAQEAKGGESGAVAPQTEQKAPLPEPKAASENIAPQPVQQAQAQPSGIDPNQKEEIKRVVEELKTKMIEIDKIIADLKSRDEKEKNQPKKTQMLLTEIKVPSLELLK